MINEIIYKPKNSTNHNRPGTKYISDYEDTFINEVKKHNHIIAVGATGAGKSTLIAGSKKLKVKGLLKTAKKRFMKRLALLICPNNSVAGSVSIDGVPVIAGQGKAGREQLEQALKKGIAIVNTKHAKRLIEMAGGPKSVFPIVDEFHDLINAHYKGDEIAELFELVRECDYCIGLTATPFGYAEWAGFHYVNFQTIPKNGGKITYHVYEGKTLPVIQDYLENLDLTKPNVVYLNDTKLQKAVLLWLEESGRLNTQLKAYQITKDTRGTEQHQLIENHHQLSDDTCLALCTCILEMGGSINNTNINEIAWFDFDEYSPRLDSAVQAPNRARDQKDLNIKYFLKERKQKDYQRPYLRLKKAYSISKSQKILIDSENEGIYTSLFGSKKRRYTDFHGVRFNHQRNEYEICHLSVWRAVSSEIYANAGTYESFIPALKEVLPHFEHEVKEYIPKSNGKELEAAKEKVVLTEIQADAQLHELISNNIEAVIYAASIKGTSSIKYDLSGVIRKDEQETAFEKYCENKEVYDRTTWKPLEDFFNLLLEESFDPEVFRGQLFKDWKAEHEAILDKANVQLSESKNNINQASTLTPKSRIEQRINEAKESLCKKILLHESFSQKAQKARKDSTRRKFLKKAAGYVAKIRLIESQISELKEKHTKAGLVCKKDKLIVKHNSLKSRISKKEKLLKAASPNYYNIDTWANAHSVLTTWKLIESSRKQETRKKLTKEELYQAQKDKNFYNDLSKRIGRQISLEQAAKIYDKHYDLLPGYDLTRLKKKAEGKIKELFDIEEHKGQKSIIVNGKKRNVKIKLLKLVCGRNPHKIAQKYGFEWEDFLEISSDIGLTVSELVKSKILSNAYLQKQSLYSNNTKHSNSKKSDNHTRGTYSDYWDKYDPDANNQVPF